ncbi:MAG: cutinase family protein [Trebonia sp.]
MLLLAVTLAAAAALSSGTVAHAAPAATSSTPCSFNPVTSCQSTNASVTLNSHYTGASACTFTWQITWADGTTSDVTDTDPADGYQPHAKHTYAKAGAYHIIVTGQVTAGDCSAANGDYNFTLVKTTPKCSTKPVVYYVHGIGQGPTVSHPQLSQSATLDTFNQDLGETIYSYTYTAKPVLYPAADGFNLLGTWDTYMNDGVRNLQSAITRGNNATCAANRHIVLVGYSMGAWVIDKWLQQHKSNWKEVAAVALYGDPCWTSSGDNEGLTRLSLLSYGCPPGKDYPAPAAKSSVPFPIRSYSLNKDPVSGQGFQGGGAHLANRAKQLAAAGVCLSSRTCPHLDYQLGYSGATLVEEGATFVAGQLHKYGIS